VQRRGVPSQDVDQPGGGQPAVAGTAEEAGQLVSGVLAGVSQPVLQLAQ
jgi:hypothetical protein